MATAVVNGVAKTVSAMNGMMVRDLESLRRGVRAAAQIALDASRIYVPVDTTALRSTGHIEEERTGGNEFRAAVVYGGQSVVSRPDDRPPSKFVDRSRIPDVSMLPQINPADVIYVDYAVFVHEDLSKNHLPPTCAKFLERAVRENEAAMSRAVGFAFQREGGNVTPIPPGTVF